MDFLVPDGYKYFKIIASGRTTNTSNSNSLHMRFNDDTAQNYGILSVQNNGTTAAASLNTSLGAIQLQNSLPYQSTPSLIEIMVSQRGTNEPKSFLANFWTKAQETSYQT